MPSLPLPPEIATVATPLLLFGVVALGVAAWNRLFAPVPWGVALLFCGLVAVYQAPTLFTERVDLPGGVVGSVFPWRALGHAPVEANTGIVLTELVPWTAAARRQLLAGEMPLWNRGLGAGAPLLANQQTAIFHPFTLLGLALPLGKAWTLSVGLRLFSCLFFLFVFLSQWRLPAPAAVFGAVAYTFCTFHVVWLLFPLGLATMALPMGLAAATELIRRPRPRSFLLLSVALALAALGGHPESALFAGITVGAYALYLVLAEPSPPASGASGAARAARLALAAAAAVAAALLTAPVWMPTAAVLPLTARYQAFRGLAEHPPGRRVNAEWLLPLVAPNILGNVQSGTYRRPAGADRSIPADYGEVATGYCGIAALALTLAGLGWPPRRPAGFFLVALAVAFATLAEAPGWYPLVCRIPVLGVALHQRLRFLWSLGLAVGAATALASLLDGRLERRALWRGLAGAALLLAAVHAVRWRDLAGSDDGTFFRLQLAWQLGALLLLAALVAARLPPRLLAAAAVALTFLELGALTWRYNPAALPADVLPSSGAVEALRRDPALGSDPALGRHLALGRDPAPHRIAAVGASFLPDTPGFFGLEDIKTTDPIHDPRYSRLLQECLGVRPGDYNQRLHDWQSPLLDYLNVTALYGPPDTQPADPSWQPIYRGPDGEVFANPRALPRYFLAARWRAAPTFDRALALVADIDDFRRLTVVDREPRRAGGGEGQGAGGTVRVVAYTGGSTRLEVVSLGENLLVTSDASWPGWRVTWNGAPLAPVVVNGAFVGAFLPPGRGTLDLRYRPRQLDIGLALAAGTLLACAAGLAVWHVAARRGRPRPDPPAGAPSRA